MGNLNTLQAHPGSRHCTVVLWLIIIKIKIIPYILRCDNHKIYVIMADDNLPVSVPPTMHNHIALIFASCSNIQISDQIKNKSLIY